MQTLPQLDLGMIKQKLADREEGQGWEPELCDTVEQEYLRFLHLKLSYPDDDIVPNQAVDKFWHQHILDTQNYAKDCKEIFGKFLHHYPYFGMKDEDEYQELCSAFEKTKKLYKKEFHEEYADGVARCRTACKPQKCK